MARKVARIPVIAKRVSRPVGDRPWDIYRTVHFRRALGARIKELRILARLKFRDLAALTGLSVGFLVAIEHGEVGGSLANCLIVLEALDQALRADGLKRRGTTAFHSLTRAWAAAMNEQWSSERESDQTAPE